MFYDVSTVFSQRYSVAVNQKCQLQKVLTLLFIIIILLTQVFQITVNRHVAYHDFGSGNLVFTELQTAFAVSCLFTNEQAQQLYHENEQKVELLIDEICNCELRDEMERSIASCIRTRS